MFELGSDAENIQGRGVRCVVAFLLATYSASALRAASPISTPDVKTAPGFEVMRLYAVPRETAGSWVSLAADDRGRLYASDQYGPLHRITLSTEPGGAPTVTKLSLPIGGAHGLTWIDGSLYAVVGQKAAAPTGLYRIRDTDA